MLIALAADAPGAGVAVGAGVTLGGGGVVTRGGGVEAGVDGEGTIDAHAESAIDTANKEAIAASLRVGRRPDI